MEGQTPKKRLHYAYVIACGLVLMCVVSSFINGTNPLFMAPVMKDFGCSTKEYTLTLTLFMLTTGAVTPWVGRLYQKYDVRLIEAGATIGCALVCVIRGLAPSIYWWWFSGILLGFCFPCIVTLLLPTMINRWFVVKIGTVMSIIGIAEGFSDIVFNTVGSYIIASYGWRACEIIWAVSALVVGLPTSLLLLRNNPQDMDLLPMGYESRSDQCREEVAENQLGISYKEALKTSAFWLLVAALGFVAITSTTGFINAYTQSVGYSIVMAGMISSAMSVGKLIGKACLGPISDFFGAKGSFLFSAACEFIGIMGVAIFAGFGAAPAAIAVFTGIAGVNSSVGTMAFPIMTREIFGVREYPAIWAQVARWMSWLGALNSLIWGSVVDFTGTYLGAFYISSFVGLLPIVFLLLADKKGKDLRKRWTEL